GHFHADVVPRQFSFDLYAVMMSCHFHLRLLGEDDAESRARIAFERLLTSARVPVDATTDAPTPSEPHSGSNGAR
nr:hypothetical protein [Planctomycetota bacterium]